MLPAPLIAEIRRRRNRINLGDLRRIHPISRSIGLDRGTPIDRHYIERFLHAHSRDVRGRVLEIGDDRYTTKFGGRQVEQSDVLHVYAGNPQATIVADLAQADHIPSASFDCIICTQTMMFVPDVFSAVRTLRRILKPNGVLLATIAGISQICRWDADQWGDYWRVTSMGAKRLFESAFPPADLEVNSYGNVLAAVGFLHGMAAEEFKAAELEHHDRDYELLITIRAVKR